MKCGCGCGVVLPEGRRFVNGHNGRGRPIPLEQRAKISASLRGKKHPPDRIAANARARKARGSDHGKWKGDNASYEAIHMWLRRNRHKTGSCEKCGCGGRTEWANVSGEYRREDPSDWRELCVSCHRTADARNPKRPWPGEVSRPARGSHSPTGAAAA